MFLSNNVIFDKEQQVIKFSELYIYSVFCTSKQCNTYTATASKSSHYQLPSPFSIQFKFNNCFCRFIHYQNQFTLFTKHLMFSHSDDSYPKHLMLLD